MMILLIAGILLVGLGAIITVTAIPHTSWDASRTEIKSAFRVMMSNPRFKIGVGFIVIGFLALLYVFSILMV